MWISFVIAGGIFVLSAPAVSARDLSSPDVLTRAEPLAGSAVRGLAIVIAPELPAGASPGAEGWTLASATGDTTIFVYERSEIFLCARRNENPSCMLRIASILVHEAWHVRHGPREDGAYSAQLVFLMTMHASVEQPDAVRMSRDLIVPHPHPGPSSAMASYGPPRSFVDAPSRSL